VDFHTQWVILFSLLHEWYLAFNYATWVQNSWSLRVALHESIHHSVYDYLIKFVHTLTYLHGSNYHTHNEVQVFFDLSLIIQIFCPTIIKDILISFGVRDVIDFSSSSSLLPRLYLCNNNTMTGKLKTGLNIKLKVVVHCSV
jgi:hypothetical protein